MKQLGRREFIRYSTGSIALLLLGKFVELPLVTQPVKARISDGQGTVVDTSNRFTMVIDVGACIGCRTCQWVCKEENNIPDTISPPWIEVFELKNGRGVNDEPHLEDLKNGATTSYTKSPLPGRWYMPVACNHCDNPPCVKVCPVGATYKDKDGLVLIDYNKCIGCRFCVVACPYSARRFNLSKPEIPADKVNPLVPVRPVGVVEKCTFCVHRTRRGILPRCVVECPVKARHFGNLNDPESEVSRLLNSVPYFRLLQELNTGPNLRYIVRGKKWQ